MKCRRHRLDVRRFGCGSGVLCLDLRLVEHLEATKSIRLELAAFLVNNRLEIFVVIHRRRRHHRH
jgi:hypothetical protein